MKPKQITQINKNYVIQANQICRASYIMPVLHRRLIFLAMSKMEIENKEFMEIRLPIGEIVRTLNLSDQGNVYEEIRAAARGSFSHSLEIEKSNNGWRIISWWHHIEYISELDIIEMRLHDDLKPYILALKEAFTLIKINDIIKLQSKYALRI